MTFFIDTVYVSAGSVAEPIIWTVGEVVGTLLSMVGVKAADTVGDYDTSYEELFGSGDDLGYLFSDEFANKCVARNAKTKEEISGLVSSVKQKIADAQISGRIEGFTNDMYDVMKTWAEDVFQSKAPVVIPSGYEGFFTITGWEVGKTSNNELSSMTTMMAKSNIVLSRLTDTNVYIYILGLQDTSDYVYCYSGEGSAIYAYNKSNGIKASTDYSGMQQRSYTNYGTYVSSTATVVTNVMGGTLLYISSGIKIYSSWADYVAGNPPITLEGEDDYPAVTTVDEVNKLWEKYGDLANLDARTGAGSLVKEGILDIPVVGENELAGVIDGTIALDDALPYALVDTVEDVVIDDAYVDDAVPDTPWEEIDYGDNEPYIITGDLTTLFPFCIPFDLIRVFKLFKAEAKAPYWEIPIKSDNFNIDYTFKIDFSQFETLAQVFRILEVVGFILGLVLVTRALIKG